MATLYKKLSYNGQLMIPYDLIRMMGLTNASVLARLIAEEQYAYSNDRTTFMNNLLISKSSLCQYLKLTRTQLMKSLDKLKTMKFILKCEIISDYISVYLDKDLIASKVQNTSRKMNYPMWNADFKRIYDINSHKVFFSDSTNKLIEYCESKYITFLAHTYYGIDCLVKIYEQNNDGNFFDTFKDDIVNFIQEQTTTGEYSDFKLYHFINGLCNPPE